MSTRVVYWNNIPAPYMVERFNALAARGNLDFEAWFSARTKKDRQWVVDERTWEFQHRYLPSIDRGTYPFAIPTPLFGREVAPDVLVSLYAGPTFLLGCAVARRRGARTAFWVEVTFDAWVKRRKKYEALKSWFFPRADAILTAGKDGARFAQRYGTSAERVFEVPHVVDSEPYARGSKLSDAERAAVRRDMGIRGTCFIYVGRLWSGKGIQFLIDAFADLVEREAEATLLLVGDGVDEAAFRAECRTRGLERVIFTGFHHLERLSRLYGASDVFVFPTLGDPFGMVVLEAMACGLPVIATTASGEIGARVTDGVNGFLVPPADSAALLDRMGVLARNPQLRIRMGEASKAKVAGQTPDLWAEAFEQAVEKILEMPPVRNTRPRRGFRPRRAVGDHTP